MGALESTFVAGVTTNRDFLIEALRKPAFIEGAATTAFVGDWPFAPLSPSREAVALAALLIVDEDGPPAPTAEWRAAPLKLAVDGADRRVSVRREDKDRIVTVDGEDVELSLLDRADREARYAVGGVTRRAAFARDGDELWLDAEGQCWRFSDRTYAAPSAKDADADGFVRSPVAGVVVTVEAKAGDAVRRGDVLATVEAMKMQYAILAAVDGVIAEAHAVKGRQAEARALLFSIAPPSAPGG